MTNINFTSLLTENRRSDDDFVNATQWCKQFSKRWAKFEESPETKGFIRACCESKQVPKRDLVQSVKGSGTWVHPLIAIKLAEWLSPEFEVYVKETFKSFLESPEDFAADILINSHNKDRVERAKKRVLVSGTNKETMELAKLDGASYPEVHNNRYRGLYRKNATQLREEAGLKKSETPLDRLSAYDLNLNSLANQMALMSGDSSKVLDAANGLRLLHEQTVGKPLVPTWEEKLLRPNQAKAIAYSPEYQTELPVS
jgi:hypothetical protein